MNASPLVLIVEDEEKIARLLAEYLENLGGFRTHVITRGDEVLMWVGQHAPALILLDLMLPEIGGIELCKALRARSDVPIIMVTARVEEVDRLLGLELGADDYVCKPFSPREVVARVRAVLRRGSPRPQAGAARLQIEAERFEARVDGRKLRLTPAEFALLRVLAAHPGRVYSRDQLISAMYADYRVVSDRTVDSHIKNLRRKLGAAAPKSDLIESVYGLGYRLRS